MPPSQPITIAYSPEDLRDRFVRATVDRADDARWHFRMAVPAVSRLRPEVGLGAPTREAPVRTLGSFYREDLPMDVDVLGAMLSREIDPLYWLELALEFNRITPTSILPLPLEGGRMGDAVCEWSAGGRPYAGRFVALKFGPRLFVVGCRAPRDAYEEAAQDFFVGLTQFAPQDDRPGRWAEPLREVAGPAPVPWRLSLPESWTLIGTGAPPRPEGFEATLSPPAPEDPPMSTCWTAFPGAPARPVPPPPPAHTHLGRLAFSVVPGRAVPTFEEAEEGALETFREAGLELAQTDFRDEPPQGRLEESRYLRSPARLSGAAGAELSCRVGRVGHLWAVAGVVGPARSVNPFAWMQNQRALDIALSSFSPGD